MTGREYGKALFLLAEEEQETEEILSALTLVRDILKENPDYVSLLDTPAVSAEIRLSLIDEAFREVTPHVKNTVKLLCEKHAVHLVFTAAETFVALYDESRGNLRVEAITAVPMGEKQLAAIHEKLTAKTGKHIFIRNTVDPAILGGVVLRYGGIQLDGSVKMKLTEVEKTLKSLVL